MYCIEFELDCEKKTGFKINDEYCNKNLGWNKSISCLQSTERHVCANEKWQRVVFIDERIYELDGSDGDFHHYYNLRKEQQLLSRRPMGGSGTMVWQDTDNWGELETKLYIV